MNSFLREIFDSNSVRDENGNKVELHSSIHVEEIEFISNIIKTHHLSRAVEVGCAMGISSLAIADAINGTSGSFHHILDPNQQSQWKNIGINNLRKAGFQNFNLIEDYSEFALPRLVREGVKVNFGFIDGWHTFDHTLIDFFYINRMLEPGGVIIIDDVQMPAVNKAVRYIYNYPSYRFLGKVVNNEITSGRKLFDNAAKVFAGLKYVTGPRIAAELYSPKLLKSDKALSLNSSMVALQKISADERDWNWYANF